MTSVTNYARTGNNKVFLTLVGGGVFGNDSDWIIAAIRRAVGVFSGAGLDVVIVSYGGANPGVRGLVG